MRLFLLTTVLIGAVNAVLHQSSTQNPRLRYLASFEMKVTDFLRKIITEKHGFIQQFSSRFQKLVSVRSSGLSRDDYINNPAPALVLTRRLAEDWSPLAWMVQENHGLSQLGLGAVRWPSTRDVDAAALTVLRAQWTYDLDIGSLASGPHGGSYHPLNMAAADCFHMARVSWKHLYIEEALEWLRQAFQKSNEGDSTPSTETLMQYFALLKCLSGDSKSAQTSITKLFIKNPLLKIKPTHQENILNAFMDMAKFNCSELAGNLEDKRKMGWYEEVTKDNFLKLRRLCRGEVKTDSRLVCRYVHYQKPHLRFQPFKLEELQLDPPVVRFHDVVTDRESEVLKTFSLEKMGVAETLNPDGGFHTSKYRTSLTRFIFPNELDLNERLSQRMGDMTRLNHELAEYSQMSRYSISGEYLPHYDFFNYTSEHFAYDRLATLMFYLNEVKEGGNTVFLGWNLSVKPVKNSAVLWFNYQRSGKPHYDSQHSGCPVLQGTKWVLNKWFSHLGNEFKAPCGLHPDDSFRSNYLQ